MHEGSHNFFISSRISPRCCSILASTKRGNLPATSIKSPRRVNINLRSRTSTRFIPDFAAASLISMRPNKLSTAAGNGPNRSRQSWPRRCNCSWRCNLCNVAVCPDAQTGLADVGDWNEGWDSLDERLLPKRHSRLDGGAHWLPHELRFICGNEIKV